MSAEPPPTDRARSNTALHHRRSILDGEGTRRTRSNTRVVLDEGPHGPILEEAGSAAAGSIDPRLEAQRAAMASTGAAWVANVRQEWDDFALTAVRRSQLVAFLGLVTVVALAGYGWQRGTLSGMAAEVSGDRISAEGAPAAPTVRSDQVAWNNTGDGDGSDARRSTASFSSDRAIADETDDEPSSGAKLFVADGKKSSKGQAASRTGQNSTAGAADEPLRNAATGSGSSDPSDSSNPDATSWKRTETKSATAVRYEDCAEAAAAGAAPMRLGEPGYRLSLDQDKNGIACENGSAAEDPGDAPVDSLYSNPTTTSTPESSGTTTTASSTGAGTTSTVESTTTSSSSTTGSSMTSSTSESNATSSTTASTTTSTTPSTTTSSTTTSSTTTSTPSSTTSTSSSTTTTPTTSTTVATTTSSTTATTTASTTLSTTGDPTPIDPISRPGARRTGFGPV